MVGVVEAGTLAVSVAVADVVAGVIIPGSTIDDDGTVLNVRGSVKAAANAEGVVMVKAELRLLYICNLFEPPQYSNAFPLQGLLQPVVVVVAPRLGAFPQKPVRSY
jgi:hypothetical protein